MAAPGSGTGSQFLRFAAVGAAGFVVDASVLHFATHVLASGLYLGRVLSYLAAATATWMLNRRYTFAAARSDGLVGEWSRFLATNAVGGLVNYAVYAALVTLVRQVALWPALGVAAGSLAGLLINFTLSRRLVFRGSSAQV
jgi:putative flippase GtrA